MSISAHTDLSAEQQHSDALVIFGFSGDLAAKKISQRSMRW